MNNYFAYTDEAGNTGSNLFDSAQPLFVTCTLLSKYNLDIVSKGKIENILNTLGEKELHANELGLEKIEHFAQDILELLQKYEVKPIFTVVNKLHVAKLKLFDTFFDSGLNPNVSNIHYGTRYLRLPLSLHVATNISHDMAKRFWDVYKKHDAAKFKDILEELKSNINNKKIDKRASQLLNHALEYAINNPLELLNHQRDTKDAPNIVAFGLLINGLHDFSKQEKGKIKEFVHDEQNEFAKTMEELFTVLKNFSFPQDKLSYIGQLTKQDNFKNKMAIKSSIDSYGLQMVDICLWLFSRKNPNIFQTSPYSLKLKTTLELVSNVFYFTLDQLEDDVIEILHDTESNPLSKENRIKAYNLIDKINKQIGI